MYFMLFFNIDTREILTYSTVQCSTLHVHLMHRFAKVLKKNLILSISRDMCRVVKAIRRTSRQLI